MAAVEKGLLSSVNAPFAESRLSSLATLYYSFHTFEFSICQKALEEKNEVQGEGRQGGQGGEAGRAGGRGGVRGTRRH